MHNDACASLVYETRTDLTPRNPIKSDIAAAETRGYPAVSERGRPPSGGGWGERTRTVVEERCGKTAGRNAGTSGTDIDRLAIGERISLARYAEETRLRLGDAFTSAAIANT